MSSGIEYDPNTRKFIVRKCGYKKYCADCQFNIKSQEEGRGFMSVLCCGLTAEWRRNPAKCLHCNRNLKSWVNGRFCDMRCRNLWTPYHPCEVNLKTVKSNVSDL